MKLSAMKTASLLFAVAVLAGCWYHRLEAPSPVAKATEYEGAIAWSFFWGALQNDPLPDNCNGQALAEVKATSNFGFALLEIITLGLVAPERVEWRCAKAMPRIGSPPGAPGVGGHNDLH